MIILITGSTGRVGRGLEAALQEPFPDRVVAASREEMDLTDASRLAMEMERLDPPPTVVINCAAITSAERAETHPDVSREVNVTGVAALGRACRELGCRLIHLSSVEVFSGEARDPYREDAIADSRSVYGKIRRLGELAASQECPDHLVVRLSMLCGDGADEDPLQVVRRAVREEGELPWQDRRVTPIWMEDFVSAMQTILRSDWKGVLHLGNSGACILSDLSSEVARLLGATREPDLGGGVGPASFSLGSGLNMTLDTAQFTKLSGGRLRDWREALRETLRKEDAL
jgi:dTDP-4-dehydrorhamnose reductase